MLRRRAVVGLPVGSALVGRAIILERHVAKRRSVRGWPPTLLRNRLRGRGVPQLESNRTSLLFGAGGSQIALGQGELHAKVNFQPPLQRLRRPAKVFFTGPFCTTWPRLKGNLFRRK